MPRGWGRGWCWWLLSQGITQIRVGNQTIPVVPGMGIGRMIAWTYLTQNMPQSTSSQEIEEIKNAIRRLEEEIRRLEDKLRELKK